VSGTCRAGVSDAGSGARSDIHVSEVAARDPSDAPRFDLAEDQAGAPDQLVLDVLPDVPAAIDILESRAGRDANVTGQPSEDAPSDCVGEDSLDLARDSGGPSDLGHPLVDLEPDATVAVTLDAPSWEAGLGASFDSPSTAKDGTPDSDSPPADAAPDVAGRVPADAPPDSILPPVSPDAADRDGDGAADGAVVGVSWADFLETLRDRWQETPAPNDLEKTAGVQLLHAEAARGLSFPVLILVGLNEKEFPRIIREDPFLRDDARIALEAMMGYKIHTKLGGLEEERLLFRRRSKRRIEGHGE